MDGEMEGGRGAERERWMDGEREGWREGEMERERGPDGEMDILICKLHPFSIYKIY